MLKTITRLAIVAVAVVLWTGPGQAWGALVSWDGTAGSGQAVGTDNLTERSTPASLFDDFDTTPASPYGQVAYAVEPPVTMTVNNSGELATSDAALLSVTHNSGILGWGAEFLVTVTSTGPGIEWVAFSVGTESVNVPISGTADVDWVWAGFQNGTSLTSLDLEQMVLGNQVSVKLRSPKFLYASSTPPPGGQVPEPTTFAIWSLFGLIGLAVARRRRK